MFFIARIDGEFCGHQHSTLVHAANCGLNIGRRKPETVTVSKVTSNRAKETVTERKVYP